MKEQTRNTEVQINEEEIGKLPEKEFRIIIIKMIKKLEDRMEEIHKLTEKIIQNNESKDDQNLENKMKKMQESINKDLEELKNRHTEKNNTATKIKNTLEGTSSRISEAE